MAADAARRAAISSADGLRAEQKAASKSVGKASPEERPALLARAKELAEQVKAAEAAQADAETAFTAAHMAISNVVIDGVPAGGEDDFAVLDVVGEPAAIDNPKDHLELGESLGLIDMQRGAKVSGSRFYFLTGRGALLQLGLLQLALRLAVENGFIPMIPPVLVRPEVMAGTGFLGAHADEVYRVEADDLYLVGTSEVPLAGYHSDEILDLSGGPLRYAGWSSCFRREAGSYGKDTRGIIRVHQFDKVEGFVYCTPTEAEAEHQRLLGWQREMLAHIEVPYRVIDVAAGDLGSSAARKFDCEAWVPTQGAYRELTSTSNCTTFQARRLATRYRDEAGKPQTAATLNGTLGTTRWLVAILENHQQPDGSVRVPEALVPFVGAEVLEPVVSMTTIGTPLSPDATKVMLLGSGELGREVVIALQRLGVETIAVDSYDNAPGHQVAHHARTITMSDPNQLKALIEAERPDVVVPEIEAIATGALEELEAAGVVRVVPTALAARLTMDRAGNPAPGRRNPRPAHQPVPVLRFAGRIAGCRRGHRFPLRRQTGDEQLGQGPEQARRTRRCGGGLGLCDGRRPSQPRPRDRRGLHRLRLRDNTIDGPGARRPTARYALGSALRSVTSRSAATTSRAGNRTRCRPPR